MTLSGRHYVLNLFKLLRRDCLLHPLAAVFYLTARCNLNCAYCEDFGTRRNVQAEPELGLADALQVLRAIRSSVDSLILTGGEPLLYDDIVSLIEAARRELRFKQLTLLTNGLVIDRYLSLLPLLDRLVISLDAADPAQWRTTIGVPVEAAQAILDNVRTCAARQQSAGFRLIVNCVLMPETLPQARQVLDFCVEHKILVSFSPQAVRNWPRYELLVSDEYRSFLRQIVTWKKRGAPVAGSMAYLHTLLDLTPYSCFPTLAPRIMPNGDLVYPCRPIEKEGNGHGGRPYNLRHRRSDGGVESWAQAMEAATHEYGDPPRMCTSCFQQCFAEPSLMQARPLSFLYELIRYSASRRAGLPTLAPG